MVLRHDTPKLITSPNNNYPAATSQGMGHTFPSRATDYNRAAIEHCWGNVEAYLQNGTLPVNGMLCWQKTNPPVI
jgi:hypothetical protein